MINQEIQSNKRLKIPRAKKTKTKHDFGVFELTEYILLLLLSKIYLLGAMSPFAIAYFAATFPKQKRRLAFLAATLGMMASGMGVDVLKYAGAFVIAGAAFILMAEELSRYRFLYGAVSSVSLLITGTVFVAFDGFLLYDFLQLMLECILVFLFYFAFDKGAVLIRGLEKRTVFEPIEGLALIILAACVILSFKTFPYFEGAAHVLSVLVILISGLVGGFPLSCGAGVMLGLVNSISEVLPAQIVSVYVVSALCAGVLQKKGRWGVLIGFFAANGAATLYFSSSANTVIGFYYVILSGIILFLLPDRMLQVFGEVVKAPSYEEASMERLREIMSDKLTTAAHSFTELSDLFSEVVSNRISEDMHDPGALFDRTAEKVCRDCTLMPYCWQKDYNSTRRTLLNLYDKMELHGAASEKNIPPEFQHGCIRLHDFIEALNKSYELHKINLMWAGRVSESRQLAIHQFKNISSVLKHLNHELAEAPSDALRLERKVLAALDRSGIEAKHVTITGRDALHVSFEMESCGGARLCAKKAATALGHALGVPMIKMPSECADGTCRLTFCEMVRYGIETGYAKMTGQGEKTSGDNHMLTHSSDGKYVLALSDGMGRGNEAGEQSKMTILLIKRLLQAGFDKETAMRLINSMLMVSNEGESFATADLCMVNLYSGALEFIKIGAAASYIKKKDEVERVHCATLPAGIMHEPETECELKYASAGDFVIMVTDGVTDVLETEEDSKLVRLISSFLGHSPQQLADDILQAAIVASKGNPKDDMTVLVARLKEE